MALCTFANNYHMLDATPVENLFIQEFMLRAPGDFVKVYIYGLNQCYRMESPQGCIDNFSHALGLELSVVKNAFRYWERQGILRIAQDRDSDFLVEYFNIKDILYNNNFSAEKALYEYRDFNQNLQLIFGNRLLTPQEYLKIYDWIEVFNLPKEVILMMIRFYLSKKGPKLTINYLDKVADSWAKDEINTLQKAEEYIQSFESYYQDTIAVLKYLGIHRTPSKAELELYKKWSNKWNFSLNAVLHACKETTKIQSPNMAYLDKILENLYKAGLKSSGEVGEYLTSRESINNLVKEFLFNFGHKEIAITPEHQAMYIKWTKDWQLSHEAIILACKLCVRRKRTTLEKLDDLLKAWVDLGLHTPKDIKDYQNKKKKLDKEIMAVMTRAGDEGDVTLAERRFFIRWTEEWKLSFELVLLAADYACSSRADNKFTFMNKILLSWYQNGIATVQEAKEEHDRHIQALQIVDQKRTMKKQVDFTNFEQHSYTEEELNSLFEDIENG